MCNFIEVKLDDNTKIYLETAKEDIKRIKTKHLYQLLIMEK